MKPIGLFGNRTETRLERQELVLKILREREEMTKQEFLRIMVAEMGLALNTGFRYLQEMEIKGEIVLEGGKIKASKKKRG